MQQQQVPSNVLQQYRDILSECQKIQGKISELEVDRAEHVLVEETLQPLDPSRRAFRLVGECLVERTVQDVLPTIAANRENVSYCFLFLCLKEVQRGYSPICWTLSFVWIFAPKDGENNCHTTRSTRATAIPSYGYKNKV
jgi:hypothetical protein